jgi:hypothetical protein
VAFAIGNQIIDGVINGQQMLGLIVFVQQFQPAMKIKVTASPFWLQSQPAAKLDDAAIYVSNDIHRIFLQK